MKIKVSTEKNNISSTQRWQLPRTTIRILLSYTKWDKYELLSKVTDESQKSRAAFFAKAKVADPQTKKKDARKSSKKTVECTICFSEFIQKVRLCLIVLCYCLSMHVFFDK